MPPCSPGAKRPDIRLARAEAPEAPAPPASRTPPPLSFLQFEIRQLRAHLAQQDLDLAAEREAALQAPHVLSQPRSLYKVVEAGTWAEETAAESVVEELQPARGEPAAPPPVPPWGAASPPPAPGLCARLPGAGGRLLAGLCPCPGPRFWCWWWCCCCWGDPQINAPRATFLNLGESVEASYLDPTLMGS